MRDRAWDLEACGQVSGGVLNKGTMPGQGGEAMAPMTPGHGGVYRKTQEVKGYSRSRCGHQKPCLAEPNSRRAIWAGVGATFLNIGGHILGHRRKQKYQTGST